MSQLLVSVGRVVSNVILTTKGRVGVPLYDTVGLVLPPVRSILVGLIAPGDGDANSVTLPSPPLLSCGVDRYQSYSSVCVNIVVSRVAVATRSL